MSRIENEDGSGFLKVPQKINISGVLCYKSILVTMKGGGTRTKNYNPVSLILTSAGSLTYVHATCQRS